MPLGAPLRLRASSPLPPPLLVTGCLHEDGLADTADGFGAGASRERKLEIMRDSQIGTYGASALVLSLMLRAGAIASLADPALVTPALIAAHAGARATLPVFMRRVPRARQDGLAADAGRPPLGSTALAGVLGLIAALARLGLSGALVAILLLAALAGLMAWLCMQTNRRADRRRSWRARAGKRNPDPARRRGLALRAISAQSR